MNPSDTTYLIFDAASAKANIKAHNSDAHVLACDDIPVSLVIPPGFSGKFLHLPMSDSISRLAQNPIQESHVQHLLTFLDDVPHGSTITFNCAAGISRSTASCLAAMVYRSGAKTDDEIVACIDWMYVIRPQASPNPLLIKHTDTVLGLGGRLVTQVRRISAMSMMMQMWDDYHWDHIERMPK